jgi:hypothetical protein
MEIPMYICQDPACGHVFDSRVLTQAAHLIPTEENPLTGTEGRRMPSCPKCGIPFARNAFTRYTCDFEECRKSTDENPEGWFKHSWTVLQWNPVYHWENGKKVRGDRTGNIRAGNLEVLPSCPQNMNYCSWEHMIKQQERQWGYLAEAMRQWGPEAIK